MMQDERITQLLSRLASAPARFAAALSQLEDADSVSSARPGEWSPVEVLAHVRASHDIMEPRIYYILVRDKPTLLAYDDERWAEVARYASLPVIESLEAMRLRRNELVQVGLREATVRPPKPCHGRSRQTALPSCGYSTR